MEFLKNNTLRIEKYIKVFELEKNIENCIILEDDVLIPDNFKNKIEETFRRLKSIDWEMCYLGRQNRTDSEEEIIDDYFLKSEYSYWTCGYILNLKGIKKIMASNLEKNIILKRLAPFGTNGRIETSKNIYL